MNIAVLDYPISYIPYTSQVPSTSPIYDQFPMYTHRTIYVVSIDNEEIALSRTAVHLIRDKQKRAGSSSAKVTLAQKRPSALTSLDKHHALFDQSYFILDHVIHCHEVYSTDTPLEPSNFGQAIKGTNWVNWIKVAFAQYGKK